MFDKQTMKFASAVVDALPEAHESVMQGFIENPTGLRIILEELLLPKALFVIWRTIIYNDKRINLVKVPLYELGFRKPPTVKSICRRANEFGLTECRREFAALITEGSEEPGHVHYTMATPLWEWQGHAGNMVRIQSPDPSDTYPFMIGERWLTDDRRMELREEWIFQKKKPNS